MPREPGEDGIILDENKTGSLGSPLLPGGKEKVAKTGDAITRTIDPIPQTGKSPIKTFIEEYLGKYETDDKRAKNMQHIIYHNNVHEDNHEYYDNQHDVQVFGEIFNSILKVFDNDIELKLINDGDINAYHICNSKTIYIHLGLIKKLHEIFEKQGKVLTKDHIAGLISHEMVHTTQTITKKTKKIEYEADIKGMRKMSEAGFNPWGMVEILEAIKKLSSEEGTKNDEKIGSLGDEHPYIDERIYQLIKLLEDKDYRIEGRSKIMQGASLHYDNIMSCIKHGMGPGDYIKLLDQTQSLRVIMDIFWTAHNTARSYHDYEYSEPIITTVTDKAKEKITATYGSTQPCKDVLLSVLFEEKDLFYKIVHTLNTEELLEIFRYINYVPNVNHSYYHSLLQKLGEKGPSVLVQTLEIMINCQDFTSIERELFINKRVKNLDYKTMGYDESIKIFSILLNLRLVNKNDVEEMLLPVFDGNFGTPFDFFKHINQIFRIIEESLDPKEFRKHEEEYRDYAHSIEIVTLSNIISKIQELRGDCEEIKQKLEKQYTISFDVTQIEAYSKDIETNNYSDEFKKIYANKLMDHLLSIAKDKIDGLPMQTKSEMIEKYIKILDITTNHYPCCYKSGNIKNKVLVEAYFKENPTENEFLESLKNATGKILLKFDKICPYLPKEIRDSYDIVGEGQTPTHITKAIIEYYNSFEAEYMKHDMNLETLKHAKTAPTELVSGNVRETLNAYPDISIFDYWKKSLLTNNYSREEFKLILDRLELSPNIYKEHKIVDGYHNYHEKYGSYALGYQDHVQINLADHKLMMFYRFLQQHGASLLSKTDTNSVKTLCSMFPSNEANNLLDAEINKHFINYIAQITNVKHISKTVMLSFEHKGEEAEYPYEVASIDMEKVCQVIDQNPQYKELIKSYYEHIKDHLSESKRIMYQKMLYHIEQKISPNTFKDFSEFTLYLEQYIDDFSRFRDDVIKDYYNTNSITKEQRNDLDQLMYYNTISSTDMQGEKKDNSEKSNLVHLLHGQSSNYEKAQILSYLFTGDINYIPIKMCMKGYKGKFHYKTLLNDFANLSPSEKKEILMKTLIQEDGLLTHHNNKSKDSRQYTTKDIIYFMQEQIAYLHRHNTQDYNGRDHIKSQIESIDKDLDDIDKFINKIKKTGLVFNNIVSYLKIPQEEKDAILREYYQSNNILDETYNKLKTQIANYLFEQKTKLEQKLENDSTYYWEQELMKEKEDIEKKIFNGEWSDHCTLTRTNEFLSLGEGTYEGSYMEGVKTEIDNKSGYILFMKNFIGQITQGLGNEAKDIIGMIIKTIIDEYTDHKKVNFIINLMDVFIKEGSNAQKIAKIFESCGAVGVKLAQILSDQKDIIGDDTIREELAKLKGNANPLDKGALFEMSAGLENIKIKKIGSNIGSASIKQVNLVYTEEDKTYVGKFLRPTLEQNLKEDIGILKKVAEQLIVTGKKWAKDISHNIEEIINEEANFDIEVKNQKLLIEDIDGKKIRGYTVSIPKIITHNKEVIIEEIAQGKPLKDIQNPPKDINQAIVDIYLYQLLKTGHFHADLHTKNIFYDEETKTITLIDNGLVGDSTNPKTKKNYMHFMYTIMRGNNNDIIQQINQKFLTSGRLRTEDEKELQDILNHKNIGLTEKVKKIMWIMYGNDKIMDKDFNIFLKSLISIGPYIEKSSGLKIGLQALKTYFG